MKPVEPLPDCMMPDGAEPCKGYQSTWAQLQDAKNLVKLTIHELNQAQHLMPKDQEASKHLEIFVDTDNIMRINIDGICHMRVRLLPGCRIEMLGPDHESVHTIIVLP